MIVCVVWPWKCLFCVLYDLCDIGFVCVSVCVRERNIYDLRETITELLEMGTARDGMAVCGTLEVFIMNTLWPL